MTGYITDLDTTTDADARTADDAYTYSDGTAVRASAEWMGVLWGSSESWRDRDAVSSPTRRRVAAGRWAERREGVYGLTNVSDDDMPDAVAKVGLYVKEMTGMGLDYTPAELDDLTSRKVEEVPFSGDALALIIRARRGTARATLSEDPYAGVTDSAAFGLWGDVTSADGHRRMAAVGGTSDPDSAAPGV